MSTELSNVTMLQSTGSKSNMPSSRPVAELLIALNEFNEYELHTGTGIGTQPLVSDGVGSSNVTFSIKQANASTLNGKFVYFDKTSKTWKPAYAQSDLSNNDIFTAQGFAVSDSSVNLKVTTSGKLHIPFALTDSSGATVITGSYYYLCQDTANAGLIQSTMPTTGLKQIVCQVLSVDSNSTTIVLLNDLNQVDDILVTNGDGSRYLGDDGSYHSLTSEALQGRTTNCINDFEVLDIDFNNIATGPNSYGYVNTGVTINNNIASNFSENAFIISKYLVESNYQYSFVIKQNFTQVTNIEPIFSAPNNSNYLAIENGLLNFVLNGTTFKGNLQYSANTMYYFKVTYNQETGYVVSSSTDGTSYTNEIIIYDDVNYLDGLTIYLGVLHTLPIVYTSGTIDLSSTGFNVKNNTASTNEYPLSALTTKNVSTITVTAKLNGIMAAGRADATATLKTTQESINTVNNTIIADKENTDILWDKTNGLMTGRYSEVTYFDDYTHDGDITDAIVYAKDTNLTYKYIVIYPNFLSTNITTEESGNNTIVDLSSSGATFHPNTFLDRNGFNFNLKLNLTGDLVLSRPVDARVYSTSATSKFYSNVAGVDWSTFVDSGNYNQGIKVSSYLANNNTTEAKGTLYNLSVDSATYWRGSYAQQPNCSPCFAYFSFENPIRFSTIGIRNTATTGYLPQEFCVHVSNDMNNWYNVLPTVQTGFVQDGLFGNIPIDAYATWPNTTYNSYFNVNVVMPNDRDYYKYVRIGLYESTGSAIPEITGCWIGRQFVGSAASNSDVQTAQEAFFVKKDFINSGVSGINASIERKKVGTAYQVRQLDEIKWVTESPENAVVDSTGKRLAPESAIIYNESSCTTNSGLDNTHMYQVNCKKFLRDDKQFTHPLASNTFVSPTTTWLFYSGYASTGSFATSSNLLQSNTSTYDFANAGLPSEFLITFFNRVRVGHLYVQNHTSANYSTQTIKVYGSVNGLEDPFGSTNWEEIQVRKIVSTYNGEFDHYDSTIGYSGGSQANTYCSIGNITNHLTGTVNTTNYGAYNVYLNTTKAYQQYKVVVQRTVNNRVAQMSIIPKDVWLDPFATNLDSNGNHVPLYVDYPYYLSSTATDLSSLNTIDTALYSTPYSPTTLFNLYSFSDTTTTYWNPGNACRYVYFQQGFKYPVNMRSTMIRSSASAYTAELFEYYGSNNSTSTASLVSLQNWKRLASLKDKCDIPSMLSLSSTVNFNSLEYGFKYYTSILARRTTDDGIRVCNFTPPTVLCDDYTNTTAKMANMPIYTAEWSYTPVKGDQGSLFTNTSNSLYEDPFTDNQPTKAPTTAYVVMKRNDTTKYYTYTSGNANDSLVNGSSVYRGLYDSLEAQTIPYENRWMYQYTDAQGSIWYSPSEPVNNVAPEHAYMYKNIIPSYNTTYVTGIPLTATANTGSTNLFTYFSSSNHAKISSGQKVFEAWKAFTANTSETVWLSAVHSYDETTGLPTNESEYVGFLAPNPICVQGYTISDRAAANDRPAYWEFQGSNDQNTWTTLHTVKTTEYSGGNNAPVGTAGTSYYFDNQDSYTAYRWVIHQLAESNTGYAGLQCKGLFVLSENPTQTTSTTAANYTWDGNEPYNKYVYTGELANQTTYTGKIFGWEYTGVSEDIYDIVPYVKMTLNRENSRQIVQQTSLGMAYPVATSENLYETTYYSYTSGDIAGSIVPSGTPLYSTINDEEPTATADGTNNFVFGAAPAQTRYEYDYLYVANNDIPTGTMLTGTEKAFYDVDLSEPIESSSILTSYSYTNSYFTSKLKEFYHKISETTPVNNYNCGLSYNGSIYTFNCYLDGSTLDSQTFNSTELIKSSYTGPDTSLQDRAVIIMNQQNYAKLNLTTSTYNWWEWNGLAKPKTTGSTASVFRLGTIDVDATQIYKVHKLYPWRVDETAPQYYAIGDPIATLNSQLNLNEIWLDGREVLISNYPTLYKIYGNTYGTPVKGPNYFVLPNFTDRSIWGINSQTSFGYIEGGLPNIKGSFNGNQLIDSAGTGSGAFKYGGAAKRNTPGVHGDQAQSGFTFNARNVSELYIDDFDKVRPTSVKVRVKTRFC